MVYIIIFAVACFVFQGPLSRLVRHLLSINGQQGPAATTAAPDATPASSNRQAAKPARQELAPTPLRPSRMSVSQHRDSRLSDIERELAARLLRIPSELRCCEHTGLYELISMTSGQRTFVRDDRIQALVQEWSFLQGISVRELAADEAARHFTGAWCAA